VHVRAAARAPDWRGVFFRSWISCELLNRTGISISSVQGIWRADGMQPHRVRQFKLATDPQFAPKFPVLPKDPGTIGWAPVVSSGFLPRRRWLVRSRSHGRSLPVPRGKTVGGSSSINGMVYVRGNPLDYDTWAQFGNRGWSYESVLPYFKKSEHYEPGGDDTRGRGGPLNVAAPRARAELADAFIEAAIAEGFPRNPDYNNGNQKGFGYFQATQEMADQIPNAL
jgi:choline dehydrogenase-like flavoprotein